MKLYTFTHNAQMRIGVEIPGGLLDLQSANHFARSGAQKLSDAPDPSVYRSMLAFLQAGPHVISWTVNLLSRFDWKSLAAAGLVLVYKWEDVRLKAPIPRPGKILCSGFNYWSHLTENPGARPPEFPFFFAKFPSVVIGPEDPILSSTRTKQLDYEVELAVVMGQTASRVSSAMALQCIAGYTILNDVSARDVQFTDSQITLGKNFDSFAPLGPALVTKDEIPDPANLRLMTRLNGQLVQDGSTKDWITPLGDLLAFLSTIMTLEPGDVVSTGTPAGIGYFRKPQVFLQPGDKLSLEIEGLGQLNNSVMAAVQ